MALDRREETQQMSVNVGFRSSTQPTYFRISTQNLRTIDPQPNFKWRVFQCD